MNVLNQMNNTLYTEIIRKLQSKIDGIENNSSFYFEFNNNVYIEIDEIMTKIKLLINDIYSTNPSLLNEKIKKIYPLIENITATDINSFLIELKKIYSELENQCNSGDITARKIIERIDICIQFYENNVSKLTEDELIENIKGIRKQIDMLSKYDNLQEITLLRQKFSQLQALVMAIYTKKNGDNYSLEELQQKELIGGDIEISGINNYLMEIYGEDTYFKYYRLKNNANHEWIAQRQLWSYIADKMNITIPGEIVELEEEDKEPDETTLTVSNKSKNGLFDFISLFVENVKNFFKQLRFSSSTLPLEEHKTLYEELIEEYNNNGLKSFLEKLEKIDDFSKFEFPDEIIATYEKRLLELEKRPFSEEDDLFFKEITDPKERDILVWTYLNKIVKLNDIIEFKDKNGESYTLREIKDSKKESTYDEDEASYVEIKSKDKELRLYLFVPDKYNKYINKYISSEFFWQKGIVSKNGLKMLIEMDNIFGIHSAKDYIDLIEGHFWLFLRRGISTGELNILHGISYNEYKAYFKLEYMFLKICKSIISQKDALLVNREGFYEKKGYTSTKPDLIKRLKVEPNVLTGQLKREPTQNEEMDIYKS